LGVGRSVSAVTSLTRYCQQVLDDRTGNMPYNNWFRKMTHVCGGLASKYERFEPRRIPFDERGAEVFSRPERATVLFYFGRITIMDARTVSTALAEPGISAEQQDMGAALHTKGWQAAVMGDAPESAQAKLKADFNRIARKSPRP
jgi:hypothetical protein